MGTPNCSHRRLTRHAAVLALLFLATSCRQGPVFVYFDSGMEAPRDSRDDAAIDKAARVLEAHPELRAAVIGHTDDMGGVALNKQLSRRRAKVVRDKLVADGVDPARVVMAARGQLLPRESNETAKGRAGNRRAEIFFFDPRDGELSEQYGARLELHIH